MKDIKFYFGRDGTLLNITDDHLLGVAHVLLYEDYIEGLALESDSYYAIAAEMILNGEDFDE